MAAHSLTIVRELIATASELASTDADAASKDAFCQKVEHACGYAPGMDILEADHWRALNEAAEAKDFAKLRVALDAVLPTVQYQRFYRNLEHLRAAQEIYAPTSLYRSDKQAWFEKRRAFKTEAVDHAALAKQALQPA